MRLALLYPEDTAGLYTPKLIRYLIEKNYEYEKDPEKADYILVTLPTLFNIEWLKKIREKYKNKKIIAGGHWTQANPYPALAYVDYINIGEGFEFFRDLKDNSIDDLPYVLSKKRDVIRNSEFIAWQNCPVIQESKQSYRFWYSQGCRYKCSFCSTSWNHKFQKNPTDIRLVMSKIKGKNSLNLIANEYFDTPSALNMKSIDVTVRAYIKEPRRFAWIKTGVEATTEEVRRFFRKPMTQAELQEFVEIVHKLRQNTKIFMIAGLESEESWMKFLEIIPEAKEKEFTFSIIINYLGLSAGTPLQFMDMRDIKQLDFTKIFYKFKRKNANIRFYGENASLVREHIHTLVERTNLENIEKVMEVRKRVLTGKIKRLDEFFEECYRLGLDKEVEGDTNIKLVPGAYRDLLQQTKSILQKEWEEIKKKI